MANVKWTTDARCHRNSTWQQIIETSWRSLAYEFVFFYRCLDLCSVGYCVYCCFYHCIMYLSIQLQSCQSVSINLLTYLLTSLRWSLQDWYIVVQMSAFNPRAASERRQTAAFKQILHCHYALHNSTCYPLPARPHSGPCSTVYYYDYITEPSISSWPWNVHLFY